MKSKLNGTAPLATSAGLNIGRAVALAFAVTLVMTVMSLAQGMDGNSLKWAVDAEAGRLTVRRAEDKREWRGEQLAEIDYWDANGKEHSQVLSAANGWTMERNATDHGCRLECRQPQFGFSFLLGFTAKDDVLTVSISSSSIAETGAARLKSMRLLPRFGAATEGDPGCLIIPKDVGILCQFRDKSPAAHRLPVYVNFNNCNMPLFGLIRDTSGFACIVSSGQFDAQFRISTNWGPRHEYAADPAFT